VHPAQSHCVQKSDLASLCRGAAAELPTVGSESGAAFRREYSPSNRKLRRNKDPLRAKISLCRTGRSSRAKTRSAR
jgi:hypothetical protein